MKHTKLIVILILIILALFGLLVFQNTEVVTIKFMIWELKMSRILLLLLTLAAGFLCGFLVAKWGKWKLPGSRASATAAGSSGVPPGSGNP
jgi:uncharacterized integral membrane protein